MSARWHRLILPTFLPDAAQIGCCYQSCLVCTELLRSCIEAAKLLLAGLVAALDKAQAELGLEVVAQLGSNIELVGILGASVANTKAYL